MNVYRAEDRAANWSARLLCIELEADAGPARLGECLSSLGAAVEVVRMYAGDGLPPLDGFDGVIPLGGSMNALDDEHFPYLASIASLLQAAVPANIPVLGICLGAQLLARALGARIWRKPRMEVGYFPVRLTAAGRSDPLFAGLGETPLAFQWHEDAFDLPAGAILLADSDRDSAQAFRAGPCYGLQFHPEVTEQGVASWCAWGPLDLTAAAAPTTPEALRLRSREVDARYAEQTARLCANWLDVVAEASAVRQHSRLLASGCGRMEGTRTRVPGPAAAGCGTAR